jgi:hypothetical protein
VERRQALENSKTNTLIVRCRSHCLSLLNLSFFVFLFLLGYIHCTGAIHCDNSKWPYIVHCLDDPYHLPFLLPHALLCLTYSNCKRFHHSISYKYMKSINHIPSPSSCFNELIIIGLFEGLHNPCLYSGWHMGSTQITVCVPTPFSFL